MPEGHTIHRLARDHKRAFGGLAVRASALQERFEAGAKELDGRVLTSTEAWGKHLLHHYDGGLLLHVHLGLYGKWPIVTVPAPGPKGALRLRIENDSHVSDLRGPTACELFTPEDRLALFARLGPDPLRSDADPDKAWARISRSRQSIGALLMDQRVLAGVGNVYRAEVLFRHGVGPHRAGRDLHPETWAEIWADLVVLLKAGVRTGRIVTTEPHVRGRTTGRVRREDAHYVYRRQGGECRRCGHPVSAAVMVGRNLFWCPNCQPV